MQEAPVFLLSSRPESEPADWWGELLVGGRGQSNATWTQSGGLSHASLYLHQQQQQQQCCALSCPLVFMPPLARCSIRSRLTAAAAAPLTSTGTHEISWRNILPLELSKTLKNASTSISNTSISTSSRPISCQVTRVLLEQSASFEAFHLLPTGFGKFFNASQFSHFFPPQLIEYHSSDTQQQTWSWSYDLLVLLVAKKFDGSVLKMTFYLSPIANWASPFFKGLFFLFPDVFYGSFQDAKQIKWVCDTFHLVRRQRSSE